MVRLGNTGATGANGNRTNIDRWTERLRRLVRRRSRWGTSVFLSNVTFTDNGTVQGGTA